VTARLEFLPEASQQVEAADEWWRENRPAARDLFARELGEALSLLEAQPTAGRPLPRPDFPKLRLLLLPRTRYHVYYEHDAGRGLLLVRSVWSAVRGRAPQLRPRRC